VLFNENTASSAEQVAIALKIMEKLNIKIHYIYCNHHKSKSKSKKSAGLTTTNIYFPLKNGGGIEIPYGIMSDYKKKSYKYIS